jgi:hypothetical protein
MGIMCRKPKKLQIKQKQKIIKKEIKNLNHFNPK